VTDDSNSLYTPQGYVEGGLRDPKKSHLLAGLPPGLHVSRRSLPPGVVVVEDYLAPPVCADLLAYARRQQGTPSTVQDKDAQAGSSLTRLSASRVTDYIDIAGVAPTVHRLMQDIFLNQVGRHYGVSIEWYERPELLRYRAGGHYSPHADSENWDAAGSSWRRSIDRDYSILLYLNEGFTGGGLEFANFGLRLTPRAGMLVAFPADHRYVHAAQPITEGERLVLVCWCAARGTARVGESPPPGVTRLDPA